MPRHIDWSVSFEREGPSPLWSIANADDGKIRRTLDKEREEIIRTTIARFYLKPTRPPFSRLVREAQTNCVSAGVKAPNWPTIKDRLESIDLWQRAKRRGEMKIIKVTVPTPAKLRASRPLEIVQIDRTKADVFGFCRKFSQWPRKAWDDELVYPASAENCCAGRNLLVACNCPLRIMCMSSMPAMVAAADRNDLNPSIGHTTRLTARWSCSTMLLSGMYRLGTPIRVSRGPLIK